MAKLSKDRLIFGVLLIIVVGIAEIIFGKYKLAAWPAFMVMIFFFEAHMELKKAPDILLGGLFGIANLIFIKMFIIAFAPHLGVELAQLIYVLVFVYLIVALGEILPVVFNNYAFMFLTVAGGVIVFAPHANVFAWMGLELIGGAIFIATIIGMMKIMSFLTAEKA